MKEEFVIIPRAKFSELEKAVNEYKIILKKLRDDLKRLRDIKGQSL